MGKVLILGKSAYFGKWNFFSWTFFVVKKFYFQRDFFLYHLAEFFTNNEGREIWDNLIDNRGF